METALRILEDIPLKGLHLRLEKVNSHYDLHYLMIKFLTCISNYLFF